MLHGIDDFGQDLSETAPAARQFKYSEQSDTSESRECPRLVTVPESLRDDDVDEGEDHDERVEEVEAVSGILFKAQANQLDDHFRDERPREELVEDVLNLEV